MIQKSILSLAMEGFVFVWAIGHGVGPGRSRWADGEGRRRAIELHHNMT